MGGGEARKIGGIFWLFGSILVIGEAKDQQFNRHKKQTIPITPSSISNNPIIEKKPKSPSSTFEKCHVQQTWDINFAREIDWKPERIFRSRTFLSLKFFMGLVWRFLNKLLLGLGGDCWSCSSYWQKARN
jgi:hypothetical protein